MVLRGERRALNRAREAARRARSRAEWWLEIVAGLARRERVRSALRVWIVGQIGW
jgi:hypothetical protein